MTEQQYINTGNLLKALRICLDVLGHTLWMDDKDRRWEAEMVKGIRANIAELEKIVKCRPSQRSAGNHHTPRTI